MSGVQKLLEKFRQKPIFIVFILMIIYIAYFSYYTILKHHTFQTFAYDLGIFMQYMWTTLHGHGVLYSSILESSCFSWHFQPILFFIVPLYAVFPQAETLLILQTLMLALGALPLYWIAKDELGTKVGVAFAGLYLFYPALHGVNSFDFHPVALTTSILLFCFYMFSKKQYKWGIVLAILAMMCKENISLTVVFIGFYWLWIGNKVDISNLEWRSLPKRREIIYPLCLSVLGIIWFVLAVKVIIPHFSLTGEYPFFSRYGSDGLIGNLFINANAKLWYLFHLFGPLLLTSLLNPPSLLIGLPVFAQNLLEANGSQYSIVYQFTAPLIPWLFISSIYGIKWLSTVQSNSFEIIRIKLLYVLLPAALVMALLVSPSSIALDHDMPRLTSHHEILQQAISLVPESASVYTQNELFTHVCHRPYAYAHWFRWKLDFFNDYGGSYDYILVDSTSQQSIFKWGSEESLETLETEYGIYAQGDGIYLYKRSYEGGHLMLRGAGKESTE